MLAGGSLPGGSGRVSPIRVVQAPSGLTLVAMRAVVVTHNSGSTIARCLRSLAGVETVVVDNASEDRTRDIVGAEFPGVQLVASGKNLGFGAGCNLGVAEAGGSGAADSSSWLFLNPDAWLLEGSPWALEQRLGSEPGMGAVSPALVYPDGRPQFAWSTDRGLLGEALQKLRNPFEAQGWNHGLLPRLWRRLVGPGWLCGAALCVRAEAFEAVGGFDEGYFLYFEDADLCLRLREAGWSLGLEEKVIVAHAGGGSGGGSTERHYRDSQRRYYSLHRPRWEQRVLERYLARRPYPSQGTSPEAAGPETAGGGR